MYRKSSFISGAKHSYPVCIAFAFMFSALGMLGHAQGFSLLKMLTMSATIFAVPLEALVIESYDLPLIAMITKGFILNFKFLLMSSFLLPLWRKNFFTIPSLHFICSSTYMVSSVEKNVEDKWFFYLGVSVPSYLVAIIATGGGYLLWQIGDHYQLFLDAIAHIVLPVHFTCLTLKRKKDKIAIIATLTGLIATPILVKIVSTQFITIFWIAIAGIFVFLEDMICGKQSVPQA